MTPFTLTYARWLAAEQDVHDANELLLWHVREGNSAMEAKQQLGVVNILQREAARRLRDHLDSIESEAVPVGQANTAGLGKPYIGGALV